MPLLSALVVEDMVLVDGAPPLVMEERECAQKEIAKDL